MSVKYWVNSFGSYRESENQPGEDYIEVPKKRPAQTAEGKYYWINGKWALAGYLSKDGNYYEGDLQYGDQIVPKRPSYLHTWNGTEWVFDNSKSLEEIRQKRNGLLAESDYIDLPNTPLDETVKAQWITYRQQLRDFPEICDPVNPVWPNKPNYIKA